MADTPATTAAGVAYIIPKGWSASTHGKVVVVSPPEGDAHIAIVDVGAAANADAAVAAAWKLYDPSMHRNLEIAQTSPSQNGWDAEREYQYTTSPNEHVMVVAVVVRHGAHWSALILEGSQATFEKRGGQASVLAESVHPASYTKESFAGRTAHRLDETRIAEIASFVKTGMAELDLPGVAIALVDHGRVVYEGGFGVRRLGDSAPVDARTLFMIASNTKGLTTLLLARLVDQGKLQWDEPVTQAYSSFRLGSDATTQAVEIRHLVCACTGVPRKDLDWLFNSNAQTPASSTFVQLANTVPTSKFGEVFQYSNLMASGAGYIAGHIEYPDEELGHAYDRAMQQLIFDPLGMNDTTFDMRKALAGNHASPHGNGSDGSLAVVDMGLNSLAIPFRPAGEAWSSAHDLIKYVEDELTEGVLPDGQRFISEKNVLARRVHNVQVSKDLYYGMGLMDDRTYGVSVIHHGGDLFGYHSDIVAIPSAQVGAVILTNSDLGSDLRDTFPRRLLEVLYDGKPLAAAELAAAATNDKAAIAKELKLMTIPADPAVVAQLAHRYTSPELGHIDVSSDAQGLVFDFGAWKSHIASRKNPDGTISLFTVDAGASGAEFVMTTSGGRRGLTIRDGQHAYHYMETSAQGQ
ncbi:MAG: beta-lactamase family protein [Candidatus Eremiobacteraeota bacterium]|nr:beta-lactamase family protein [Candidatus Eremiobacteraeota bacterium]